MYYIIGNDGDVWAESQDREKLQIILDTYDEHIRSQYELEIFSDEKGE